MAKPLIDPRLKERVKDLLDLHSGERRGMMVLMGFLLLLAAWAVYGQWFYTPTERDLAPVKAKLEAWIAESKAQRADTAAVIRFPFDPNLIGREEWLALGLTDKQVDGIERYLDKGGKFRTKKDVGRMYTIPPDLFAALSPFILLPDSFVRKQNEPRERKEYADRWPRDTIRERTTYPRFAPRSVELNTADTLELTTIRGIGPAFARSIVKYREALGGFHSLDQLNEVYILQDKPEAVTALREFLILDTLAIRKIPINTCTAEELAAHPYLRWKLAKPLFAYRTQHGAFKKLEEIRGCVLIDAALLRKLAPYISLE